MEPLNTSKVLIIQENASSVLQKILVVYTGILVQKTRHADALFAENILSVCRMIFWLPKTG